MIWSGGIPVRLLRRIPASIPIWTVRFAPISIILTPFLQHLFSQHLFRVPQYLYHVLQHLFHDLLFCILCLSEHIFSMPFQGRSVYQIHFTWAFLPVKILLHRNLKKKLPQNDRFIQHFAAVCLSFDHMFSNRLLRPGWCKSVSFLPSHHSPGIRRRS